MLGSIAEKGKEDPRAAVPDKTKGRPMQSVPRSREEFRSLIGAHLF